MDVDNEVRWNNFSFVLADVLRAELHLARLDIIAPLNKSCVEHDAEHRLVREASMAEENLHVTLHYQRLLLLFCEQKDYSVLLLSVLLLRWVGESLADIKATTAIDLEERNTAPT